MTLADIENKAGLCRITCGWKKPELPIDWVRRYWRDVHSPAIARRAGIYDYRHYQYDPVRGDVLAPIEGITYDAPAMEQLMWTSDVRYRDEAALAVFDKSPEGKPKTDILGDIDIIVELIGGEELPKKLIEQAIAHGKAVVTANKALISEKEVSIYTLTLSM